MKKIIISASTVISLLGMGNISAQSFYREKTILPDSLREDNAPIPIPVPVENDNVRTRVFNLANAVFDSTRIFSDYKNIEVIEDSEDKVSPFNITPRSVAPYLVGEIAIETQHLENGGFVSAIPIEVPNGIGKMTPALSLAYNSNASHGTVGQGWDLQGISSISYRDKNFYHDGTVEAATKSIDNLSLDGKRLIYDKYLGAEGYLFYLEGSNKTVTAIGNTNGITVYYGDGTMAKYEPKGSNMMWITRQEDRFGNYISYSYYVYGSYAYPYSISYGGNNKQRIFPEYIISFNYNLSSYSSNYYEMGTKVTKDRTLATINTGQRSYNFTYSWNNIHSKLIRVACNSSSSSFAPINFTYGTGSSKSALDKLETDILVNYYTNSQHDNTYTLSARFAPHDNSEGLVVYPVKTSHKWGRDASVNYNTLVSDYKPEDPIYIYPDIYNDYRSLIGENGAKFGYGFRQTLTMDADNDPSKEEVVLINTVGGSEYSYNQIVKLRLMGYAGMGRYGVLRNIDIIIPTEWRESNRYPSPTNMDFYSGRYLDNGKSMICAVQKPESHHTKLNRVFLLDLETKGYYMATGAFSYKSNDIVMTMDWNGDGKDDLFHFHDTGFDVYSFKASGTNTLTLKKEFSSKEIRRYEFTDRPKKKTGNSFSGNWYAQRAVLFGDINGDGKLDLMYSCFYGNRKSEQTWMHDQKWKILLATGTGYETMVYDMPESYWMDPQRDVIMQDYNGDGKADIVSMRNRNGVTNLQVLLSDGTKFLPENLHSYSIGSLSTEGLLVGTNLRSENQNASIIHLKAKHVALMSVKMNEKENSLLTKIDNGKGVTTDLTFARMDKKTSPYASDYGAVFPYENFNDSYWLLQSMKKTIQSSIVNTPAIIEGQNYHYSNAILHRQGKGFCGFTQVATYDYITGDNVVQTYNPQIWGRVEKTDTRDNTITYTYNAVTEGYKKEPLLQIKSATAVDKLSGFTKKIDYNSYNSYNIPLSIKSTFGNDATEETIYTYDNKVSASNYSVNPLLTTVTTKKTRGLDTFTTSAENTYDTNDLLTKDISKIEGNIASAREFAYDAFSNITSESNMPYNQAALKTAVSYTYTNGLLMDTKTNELGQKTTYTYGANSVLTKETDYKNRVTTYEYDAFRRPIKVTRPDGTIAQTSYTWATNGWYWLTQTATGKPTKKVLCDPIGREHRAIENRFDGKELKTDKQYDYRGRITGVSLPYTGTSATVWNTTSFDDYNRPTTITYASGKQDTYSYNKNVETSVIDGIKKETTTDATNRVTKIADAAGTISYTYKAGGQPNLITAPGNVVTQFTYDGYGRQTSIKDPSAGTKAFAYDAGGNLNKETDARGKVITMVYDKYNRMTEKNIDGTKTSLIYNTDGLLTKVSELQGTANVSTKDLTYDALSRINKERITVIDGKWLEKEYAYSNGNVSSIAYIASTYGQKLITQSFTYANGHLKEIIGEGVSVWRLDAENTLGIPTQVTTGSLTRNYGFTAHGLPTSRVVKNGNTVIQNFGYEFDPTTGNLKWRKDNARNKQENFAYDNLNRLTSFAGKTMSYDVKGNITDFATVGKFTYAAAKPYAVSEITPYGTDIPLRNQDIKYNSQMRHSEISENGHTSTFAYNNNDDRIRMISKKGTATELTRYYIGGQYELDSSIAGVDEKLYLDGDAYSASTVFMKKNGTWAFYYICRDYLGSITHITNASGGVVQELSYDAWGRLRNPATQTNYAVGTEPALFLGRGYTGHEHLTQYGLINMNARLYDPVIGRFLSPDPYVQAPYFSQNFNRYSYCLNNPLKYNDPSGEIAFPILAAIGNVIANKIKNKSFKGSLKAFGQGFLVGSSVSWASQFGNVGTIVGGLEKAKMTSATYGAVGSTLTGGIPGLKRSLKSSLGNYYYNDNEWGAGIMQGVSRHTWEGFQSFAGHAAAQTLNATKQIDGVEYWGGATFNLANKNSSIAVSMGNYINVKSKYYSSGLDNFESYLLTDQTMMHEYGHTFDSRIWGFGYLPIIGTQSLISAQMSHPRKGTNFDSHDLRWYERSANKHAAKYFKKYGVIWDDKEMPRYNPF